MPLARVTQRSPALHAHAYLNTNLGRVGRPAAPERWAQATQRSSDSSALKDDLVAATCLQSSYARPTCRWLQAHCSACTHAHTHTIHACHGVRTLGLFLRSSTVLRLLRWRLPLQAPPKSILCAGAPALYAYHHQIKLLAPSRRGTGCPPCRRTPAYWCTLHPAPRGHTKACSAPRQWARCWHKKTTFRGL